MLTRPFTIDQPFLAQLVALARAAGDAILDIYNAPEKMRVQQKTDLSPITAADLAAHNIIVRSLETILSIPIVSEEAALADFSVRRNWDRYWLIDPLDGTKEFIAGTGEFTVNIALIQSGVPVLGVVHVPLMDETYTGVDATLLFQQKSYAEKYRKGKKIAELSTRNVGQRWTARKSLDVLASARHGGTETEMLLQNIAQRWPAPVQRLNVGSSLKFCWIAEGRADFYPRLSPTCEWDTAAAQAVLVASGGIVVNANSFELLRCNGGESIINPSFLAFGDSQFNWRHILGG